MWNGCRSFGDGNKVIAGNRNGPINWIHAGENGTNHDTLKFDKTALVGSEVRRMDPPPKDPN
jgi:hypothetical protein